MKVIRVVFRNRYVCRFMLEDMPFTECQYLTRSKGIIHRGLDSKGTFIGHTSYFCLVGTGMIA